MHPPHQRGNVLVNMLATGLSVPTQSGVGIAAATVSPMISYEIGQKFKELAKDNPDGKLTEKQQAAHVLAHAVLGAAVAAAGGNDALAGGASAGGAEYLAPKVSTFLYGTADPEKLTAEQKDTVANIMSLAGASVGVAVGNTSTNAVSGSLNAESAVENNFSLPRNTRYISADAAQLIKKIEQSAAKILAAEDMKYIYLETYQDKIREIIANNHSEQEKQREFEQLWEKNKYVSQVLENIIKSFSVGDKDRHTFYFELVPKMDNLLLSSYYDLKLTGGKPNLLDKERTDWLPELPKTIDGKGSSIQRIHCTWTKDPDCLGILDAQGGKISGHTTFPRTYTQKGTVVVYRVEGSINQRLIIGNKGEISLYPDKKQIIWLNFGDKQRANQYLQVKIAKGLPEAELKSFEINKTFLERIERDAVPEKMARRFPNRPIVSRDPYPNQYGIPAAYFDDLVQSIRQGSGKTSNKH